MHYQTINPAITPEMVSSCYLVHEFAKLRLLRNFLDLPMTSCMVTCPFHGVVRFDSEVIVECLVLFSVQRHHLNLLPQEGGKNTVMLLLNMAFF